MNARSSRSVLVVSLLWLATIPVLAERKGPPTGKEIAQKANSAKLDASNAVVGEKVGKKIKMTPADLSEFSYEDLENGQVLAVIEGDLAGDETSLPAGKHNIFVTKVGSTWHAYAEADGRIVAEAKRVRVERTSKTKPGKAEFQAEGWCLLAAYFKYKGGKQVVYDSCY